MDQHPISRRGYLGATGVLLTGTALAGCMNSSAAAYLANSDDFSVDATFELMGEGPGEPVTLSLVVDGNEFERTLQPDEEFETELSTPYGDVEIELEYEETVEVELEWSGPGIELDVDIEQSQWDHTIGSVEIAFTNGELKTAFDAMVALPESTTEFTGTDARLVQPETEYEIDIDLSVGDDGVEGEFEVEWEVDEDDDDDANDIESDDLDDDFDDSDDIESDDDN